MKEFIMCKGLPGSGKSTWAKEFILSQPDQWVRINNDSLQLMLTGQTFVKDKKVWHKIEHFRDCMINEALAMGLNVIIDNTNLSPKREEEYRALIELHNKNNTEKYKFRVQDFTKVPLATCLAQNKTRDSAVPERVIYDMYNQFLKPAPAVLVQNTKLPKAIIVDIDGTIARHTTRVVYDNTRYYEDEPIPEVLEIVVRLMKSDVKAIFLTGRDDVGREDTIRWLKDKCNIVGCYDLLMRPPAPDVHHNSPDYEYKKYMFDTYVKDKYHVLAWFEDRVRNVEMARNVIGIKAAFQVNEGNF